MPAEYGIDYTGMGKVLGLTEMGEIKMSLAHEAAAEAEAEEAALAAIEEEQPLENQTIEAEIAEVTEQIVAEETEDNVAVESVSPPLDFIPLSRDSFTVTLAPGETAEIKVRMKKDSLVLYGWKTESGTINFDNHGDTEGIRYHNYSKGTFVEEDQGVIQAAFEGFHGWFWRNRGEETITLTLEIQGAYTEPKRVI